MPPPHPNQTMRYPPGKDVPPQAGPGSYPGYPSQSQPGGPSRVPAAYGGKFCKYLFRRILYHTLRYTCFLKMNIDSY